MWAQGPCNQSELRLPDGSACLPGDERAVGWQSVWGMAVRRVGCDRVVIRRVRDHWSRGHLGRSSLSWEEKRDPPCRHGDWAGVLGIPSLPFVLGRLDGAG